MKKIKKTNFLQILSLIPLSLLGLLISGQRVLAQITNPVAGSLGTHDTSVSTGGKFVQYTVYLWRAAITLGSLAVILFFLLGAFTWITSGGDKNKVEEARNKITNAVIGLVLLVSSFVLLSFLSRLLFGGEFNLLQLTIPGVNP